MSIDIMKYSELEKLITKTTNSRFHHQGRRHPIWRNPDTGEFFEMSRHKSEEVAKGTLNDILTKSGAKK
jgi:predicted RNA binding protein YcfA (HicA-like mRNA interferase family)